MYLKAALHLHQKVPGSMHWRVGRAGEPTLPLRTASGPQSHALRGKDDHFPEQSHPPHTPQIEDEKAGGKYSVLPELILHGGVICGIECWR